MSLCECLLDSPKEIGDGPISPLHDWGRIRDDRVEAFPKILALFFPVDPVGDIVFRRNRLPSMGLLS